MKQLLLRSSLLLIFILSINARAEETPAPKPADNKIALKEIEKVPVELEWENIPGTTLYELEFQNLEGKVVNTFKSQNSTFKFKMKVGKYQVRSRVADSRKVYSEWSGLNEFTVQPKPATVSEKNATTKGKIDPKTLSSEVVYHWGEAPGATQYKLKILNAKGEVVKEETVQGLTCKTQLPAGEYTAVLTSVGVDGIESDPVTLPGKVVIETVQLPAPEIVFEETVDPQHPEIKSQHLPMANGTPIVRWKPTSLSDTVGTLEYRYFFGDEWIPVSNFNSKSAKEVVLEKARKPGRYRLNVWAEATGLKKSEVTSYEFVVKPTEY